MTDTVQVYVTSAFSKNGAGGNKAGVVLNGSDLPEDRKLRVASMLGYSETAFVSRSCSADFELRYFTPTREVPLCGHATIAVFHTLRLLGMLDRQAYTIETKAGILGIRIRKDGSVYMEQQCPVFYDVLDPGRLAACIEKDRVSRALPIQIVSTGLKDVMLPVDSREHLAAMSPDFGALAAVSEELNVVGVHAFAPVDSPEVTAVCRNFAPLYGINEESATGTACCALACYLFAHFKKQPRFVFEQGTAGDVSRIMVRIAYHRDIVDSVRVGGYGYIVGQKDIPI